MENLLDIEKIMALLPHRYPFLLIDRVLDFQPGKRIAALKNVTMNEHFFQGHFPRKPIMPGVLIVEAMAQAGGVLALSSQENVKPGTIIFFTGIDKVRFRKPVVPGDQILFEVEILKMRSKMAKMAGKALVDDTLAAEGELMASIGAES